MKKILDCLQYEGGSIRPHVLYVMGSDPIILEGKVDFNVIGTVRLNGIKIQNTSMCVQLAKPTEFKVEKDSAILFSQTPQVMIVTEEHIPVPDVPDMQDAAIRQMHALFEQWAASRGIEIDNSVATAEEHDFDEDYDDEDNEYLFNLDIDQLPTDDLLVSNGETSNTDEPEDDTQQPRDTANESGASDSDSTESQEDAAENAA